MYVRSRRLCTCAYANAGNLLYSIAKWVLGTFYHYCEFILSHRATCFIHYVLGSGVVACSGSLPWLYATYVVDYILRS